MWTVETSHVCFCGFFLSLKENLVQGSLKEWTQVFRTHTVKLDEQFFSQPWQSKGWILFLLCVFPVYLHAQRALPPSGHSIPWSLSPPLLTPRSDRHRTMLADFNRLDLLHAPFSWPGLDSEAGQISYEPCGLQEPEWFHQVMCMKHYRCCESTCLIFCAQFPESSNMQMTCKLHFLTVKMLQLFVTVVFIVVNSNGTRFSAYQITYK